jgi:hypothetical protein
VSPLIATPRELKRLWIGVLKRLHPDLAIEERDRDRSEQFTQRANKANAARDEFALRAVLEPKGQLPPGDAPPDAWEAIAEVQKAASPQSANDPFLAPQQPPGVAGREAFGILWAACAVVSLLLYVIVDALRETVGRNTSLAFLVLLAAAVLWWITKNSRLSYNHKTKWVAAVASGVILVGINLLDNRPRANPMFPSAHAATAQATGVALQDRDHARLANTSQKKLTAMPPKPETVENLGLQLGAYIEAAKNQVAQKWNSSEVAGSTTAGATVYIQFAIQRRGTHAVPTMETSSGYSSLDASCLRAVDRIRTFDHLPKHYSGDSLTVLYHCTYPGSPGSPLASPTTKFAQDSISPPAQQPPPYGPVDAAHGVHQPTKNTVVTN